MNILLLLPILIPFLTGVMALLAWQHRPVQRALGVVGAAGLLGAAVGLLVSVTQNGILAIQIGNWPAPFGVTLEIGRAHV